VSGRRCIVCETAGPFPVTFEKAGFVLVRCPGCGLVFQDPQPTAEQLSASYYQDPDFARALLGPYRDFTLERAREKVALLRAAGVWRPGVRVLDVGSSSGAFLEVASEAGAFSTGVEVGVTVSEHARARGIDVRTGTLADAVPGLADERFDLITFWDVIEHLPDPYHELELARSMLAPGGIIAATLPNVEGLYPRLTYRLLARPTGRWEYPELPVHLYDFAPLTIRRLLARAGYDVTTLRTLATPFAFYRQTSLAPAALGGGVKGRALRAAFEALRGIAYPAARALDRQNSMFVTARRQSG
jgi:2-polyprenyl-3-methyl-5-hydroxy-6-metoxy-1,4-benzoquinol methylase